jgi:anti-sigma-K factor RskA
MSNFLIDEDTDLLAAEFVLGTLDSEERANAQSQLRMDHGFIAMVRIWERRLGELHLMVEPVEPNAKIWERIRAKVAEISQGGPAPDGSRRPR